MSEIRANTVSDAAGTGPATLTGQSAAKVWVNFNATGTIAIRNSFNVSSITDVGTGQYDINLSNSFSAADYSAAGMASNGNQNVADAQPFTGYFRFVVYTSSGTRYDSTITLVSCHGDLA